MASPLRMVWDQSMLFHRMSTESDLLAREACNMDPSTFADFQWASTFRVVHQHAMNLYTSGSAAQWGATAWTPGDFIIHFAGCPMTESECWRRFTEQSAWIEEHDR